LLLCKGAFDGRAWPGLIWKWKAGLSLKRQQDKGVRLPCAGGNDAWVCFPPAKGLCHAGDGQ
jgi:hypothetical protein